MNYEEYQEKELKKEMKLLDILLKVSDLEMDVETAERKIKKLFDKKHKFIHKKFLNGINKGSI